MNTFHDNENFVLAAPPATRLRRSPSEQRMRGSPKHLGERKRSNTRQNSKSESPNKGIKKSFSPRQNRRRQKQSKPLLTRIQQWFIGSFSCVSTHSVVQQKETNHKDAASNSPQLSSKSTPPCTPQNSQSLHSKISNDNIVAINTVDEQLSNQETRSDCPSVSFSYQQMFSDRDTAAAQANKLPSPSSIPLKSILKKPKSDPDISSSPESSSMAIEGAANNFFSSSDSVTKSTPMSSAGNSAHLGHHVAFKRPPPIRTSSSHNTASPTTPTSPILNRTQSHSSVQQPVLLARTLRRVQSDEPHQFTYVSSHAVGTFRHEAPSSPSASSVNTCYSSSPSILTLPSANTSVTLSYNNLHQNHLKGHMSSPTSPQPERTLLRIPSTNSSASFQHRVEQELQRKRSVEEEDFLLAVRLSQEDILHTRSLSSNNSHNNSHNNSFLVTSSPKPLSRSSSSHVPSPNSSFHLQQQTFAPSPTKLDPTCTNSPQVENKSNLEEEEEEEDESVFRISSSSSNVKTQTNRNHVSSDMDDDVALELALRQSLDEDVKHRQRLEIREKLALSRALVASLASTESLTNLKVPIMK